jgi:hypothetical protein
VLDGPHPPSEVPDVAAAVLDNSVDDWHLTDGGRRLTLVKRVSDVDDSDDD